jgi:recombinational DNA repair protein (RecF pathway)
VNPCARCGQPHAPFGFGPPGRKQPAWFCGECREFQPERQKAVAIAAREALEDPDIIIF